MMDRQLGCGQMPRDCFCMNSSSLERKLKNLLKPASFFSMYAVHLFTPGPSHLQQ
jgi:hypothetical protein